MSERGVHSRFVHIKNNRSSAKNPPFEIGPVRSNNSSVKSKASTKSKEKVSGSTSKLSAEKTSRERKQETMDKKFENYLEEKSKKESQISLANRPKWGQNPKKTTVKEDRTASARRAVSSSTRANASAYSRPASAKPGLKSTIKNTPTLSTSSEDESSMPSFNISQSSKSNVLSGISSSSRVQNKLFSEGLDSAEESELHHEIKNPFIVPGITTKKKSPIKHTPELIESSSFSLPQPYESNISKTVEKADKQMEINKKLLEAFDHTDSDSNEFIKLLNKPKTSTKQEKKEKFFKEEPVRKSNAQKLQISDSIAYSANDDLAISYEKILQRVDKLEKALAELSSKKSQDEIQFTQKEATPKKNSPAAKHSPAPILDSADTDEEDEEELVQKPISKKSSNASAKSPEKKQKSPVKKSSLSNVSPILDDSDSEEEELIEKQISKKSSTSSAKKSLTSKISTILDDDEEEDLIEKQISKKSSNSSAKKPKVSPILADNNDEEEDVIEKPISKKSSNSSAKSSEKKPKSPTRKPQVSPVRTSPLKTQISAKKQNPKSPSINHPSDIFMDDSEDSSQEEEEVHQKPAITDTKDLLESIKEHLSHNSFSPLSAKHKVEADEESSDDISNPMDSFPQKQHSLSPEKKHYESEEDSEEESDEEIFVEEKVPTITVTPLSPSQRNSPNRSPQQKASPQQKTSIQKSSSPKMQISDEEEDDEIPQPRNVPQKFSSPRVSPPKIQTNANLSDDDEEDDEAPQPRVVPQKFSSPKREEPMLKPETTDTYSSFMKKYATFDDSDDSENEEPKEQPKRGSYTFKFDSDESEDKSENKNIFDFGDSQQEEEDNKQNDLKTPRLYDSDDSSEHIEQPIPVPSPRAYKRETFEDDDTPKMPSPKRGVFGMSSSDDALQKKAAPPVGKSIMLPPDSDDSANQQQDEEKSEEEEEPTPWKATPRPLPQIKKFIIDSDDSEEEEVPKPRSPERLANIFQNQPSSDSNEAVEYSEPPMKTSADINKKETAKKSFQFDFSSEEDKEEPKKFAFGADDVDSNEDVPAATGAMSPMRERPKLDVNEEEDEDEQPRKPLSPLDSAKRKLLDLNLDIDSEDEEEDLDNKPKEPVYVSRRDPASSVPRNFTSMKYNDDEEEEEEAEVQPIRKQVSKPFQDIKPEDDDEESDDDLKQFLVTPANQVYSMKKSVQSLGEEEEEEEEDVPMVIKKPSSASKGNSFQKPPPTQESDSDEDEDESIDVFQRKLQSYKQSSPKQSPPLKSSIQQSKESDEEEDDTYSSSKKLDKDFMEKLKSYGINYDFSDEDEEDEEM